MTVRVVVVGAGPAGSAAAIAAAREGADVVLVDRARFPRDKACGDGITSAGVDVLRRLGAETTIEKARPVEGARLRHGTHLGVVYEKARALGVSLSRREFDNELVRIAVDAGVSFMQSARVTDIMAEDSLAGAVLTDDGTRFEADVVIVADGATSPLRRRLLGRDNLDVSGLAIRTYATGPVQGSLDHFEFVLPLMHGGRVIPGYGWVFPAQIAGRPEISANVGVGVMTSVPMRLPQPRALLADLLDRLKGIEHFADLREVGAPLSGALRSSEELPEAPYPNVLFVGDSAGLVNPLTGEGIAPALESGRIAGLVAAEADNKPSLRALTCRYKALAGSVSAPFEWFTSHFTRPAGWQLARIMMETQRPSFVALRKLWADELAPKPRMAAPDPVGVVVAEALDALPSVVLARSAVELWRDRGSFIARLFDALLGTDGPLASPDRDAAAVITLMDLHTLFMLDLSPQRGDGTSLSDGLPLLTADMLLVQAQRLATRAPQARPLLPPFGAAHAALGIQIAVGANSADPGDLEARQAALAGELSGRYLASRLHLDDNEEDRLVDICGHLALLVDLTWRLRHVNAWLSRHVPASDLPVWATRAHPDLEGLAADLTRRCTDLSRDPIKGLSRWSQLGPLAADLRLQTETALATAPVQAAC